MRDLRFWRWRRAEDDDLDREIETHLELATDEHREGELPLRDAQLAAHRDFGSVALTKEELRDMRTGAILDRLGRELRHAARRLLRSPAFTLATVLTLALAIGANVTMFTVVQRVVLNPLPYGDSGRLLSLNNGAPVRNVSSGLNLSLQLYYQYLDRARTLDGVALYRVDERTLTGAGVPERVRVARTTPSLAPVLLTSPQRGRWFTEEEGVSGASPVAAISHGFWARRYRNDSSVLGQQIVLDGIPTTVVGVMWPSFAFPDPRVDIWTPDPISRTLATSPSVAGVFDYSAIGRLREGATLADARAELTRLTHDLAPISPGNGYDQMISMATISIASAWVSYERLHTCRRLKEFAEAAPEARQYLVAAQFDLFREPKQHMAFALREGRVIFTQDEDFLSLHAAGVQHAGIAYCHQASRSLGEIIPGLALIWDIYEPEEMHNRVEWLGAALGIQAAGAVLVPISPASTADQAAYIAAHCDAAAPALRGRLPPTSRT